MTSRTLIATIGGFRYESNFAKWIIENDVRKTFRDSSKKRQTEGASGSLYHPPLGIKATNRWQGSWSTLTRPVERPVIG